MDEKFTEIPPMNQIPTTTYTYRQETSKEARAWNIALWLTHQIPQHRNKQISATKARKEIRKQLGLPTLTGQEHIGDLRAHGDAIHFLGLTCTRYTGKTPNGPVRHLRMIPIEDNNANSNIGLAYNFLKAAAPLVPELIF